MHRRDILKTVLASTLGITFGYTGTVEGKGLFKKRMCNYLFRFFLEDFVIVGFNRLYGELNKLSVFILFLCIKLMRDLFGAFT